VSEDGEHDSFGVLDGCLGRTGGLDININDPQASGECSPGEFCGDRILVAGWLVVLIRKLECYPANESCVGRMLRDGHEKRELSSSQIVVCPEIVVVAGCVVKRYVGVESSDGDG